MWSHVVIVNIWVSHTRYSAHLYRVNYARWVMAMHPICRACNVHSFAVLCAIAVLQYFAWRMVPPDLSEDRPFFMQVFSHITCSRWELFRYTLISTGLSPSKATLSKVLLIYMVDRLAVSSSFATTMLTRLIIIPPATKMFHFARLYLSDLRHKSVFRRIAPVPMLSEAFRYASFLL